MTSLASQVEDALGSSELVVTDERGLPLFKLLRRVRESDRSAFFHSVVVDEELLAQGAPEEVMLQFVSLPELPAQALARALEPCLVDHPRVQLCHSVALPAKTLLEVQPAEASPLLPPLHSLPLCDLLQVLVLVKEFSDGTGLLTWRAARGEKLKLSDISDLLETTSEALASLHRRGYSHGALLPDSIVIQEFPAPTAPGDVVEMVWAPKIIDLGLTRTLASPRTWPNATSALWCAPETFAPDTLTDWRRVDQLSLAAILYALWTDRVPFEPIPTGLSPVDAKALRRRQIEALPPPRGNALARSLGVTPAMSAACMRAMSAEPSDRFPSMDAFASALRSAAREAVRRAGHEEEDPRETTSPSHSITSRFRLSQQAKVTAPNATPTAEASVQVSLEAGIPDRAEALTEPPPSRVSRGPKADSEEEPATVREVPEEEEEEAADEPAVRLNLSGKARRAAGSATHRAPPSEDDLSDDRERSRRTKILDHPEEDDGEYPPHPDEDRDTAPIPSDPEFAQALGTHRWAFNYLSAVLLGLWLVTLTWAVLNRPPDVDDAVASEKAPAAKPGMRPNRAPPPSSADLDGEL